MKKFLALLMVIIMLFALTACGDANNSGNPSSEAPSGDKTVEVTLAAALFDGMTEQEIKEAAQKEGYITCTVNEDGSVTYTMTAEKRDDVLSQYKTAMDQVITDLLTGAGKITSFVSIESSEDYSQVDVYVDAQKYTAWDSLYALSFYVTGAFYQSFAGVAEEDIDVVVNFIDNDTKKVLDTASYKDFRDNMTGENQPDNDQGEIKFTETVVLDHEECKITVTGIEPDNLWGYTLKVQLENKSKDKKYMFSVESASINGVQCDPYFASTVTAGKKANEDISFSDEVLRQNGVGKYTDIALTFRVYDDDDWSAADVVKHTVHIYPHGKEQVTKFVRQTKDSDIVLINNEYVTAIVTGFEDDPLWGYTAKLFLVNKTDDMATFNAEDVSVNGFMSEPLFAEFIAAGNCAFSEIGWSRAELNDNKITEVSEIEFKLLVYDEEGWPDGKCYVSEVITLNP